MNHRRAENLCEQLVDLDTKTKTLISLIRNVNDNNTNNSIKSRRDKLDQYQTQIRENLTAMSSLLNDLQTLVRESRPVQIEDAVSYNKEQLNELQGSYRKAIFTATTQLDAAERDELIRPSATRNLDQNLEDQFQSSLELTQDMATYARLLAEEVERGAVNAQLLEESSNKITGNYSELKDMSGHLGQSKRLTSMMQRRRQKDRIFFFLAYLCFFLSCATIFLRRIPLGPWLLPSFL